MAELEVRYVTTADGVRIAYAIAGSGPPMVTFSDPIASHVQLGWSHPVLGRFFQEMARRNTVLFFDFRGCGLSDRVPAQSIEDPLRDAEAVVERVRWREFAMNSGGGGTPAAIAFVARHPEQVTRLAIADGFARANDLLNQPQVQALVAAAKLDWILATEAIGTAAFGAGREESSGYGAYIRSCIGPEYMQNTDALAAVDVSELAGTMKAPTLVLKQRTSVFDDGDGERPRRPYPERAPRGGGWGLGRRPGRRRVGHTEMMSRLGDEKGRAVLREHERITREVLKVHGGTEVKTMGDGFMARASAPSPRLSNAPSPSSASSPSVRASL
jgi:pimeloyl-ACP methyl ester carboxylesterase